MHLRIHTTNEVESKIPQFEITKHPQQRYSELIDFVDDHKHVRYFIDKAVGLIHSRRTPFPETARETKDFLLPEEADFLPIEKIFAGIIFESAILHPGIHTAIENKYLEHSALPALTGCHGLVDIHDRRHFVSGYYMKLESTDQDTHFEQWIFVTSNEIPHHITEWLYEHNIIPFSESRKQFISPPNISKH